MHLNATSQQQQAYQKKLLQQQQQQMTQFHAASMELVQSPASASSHQTPAPTTSLPVTPRHAITSRMGPPSNSNLASSMGLSALQPNYQQQQTIVESSPSSLGSESTSHFGPGAGLARLLQYTEALKGGPDRQTSEYWKSFVEEFFLPESRMHLVLWNPTTHEHKGFEVPASVVARWMQTNYTSGVVSSSLSMESPREYMSGQAFPPPPRSIRAHFHLPSGNVTHFVECKRSLLINNFENGWQVQMNGLVRAAFVPHTRVLPPSLNASKDDLPVLQTHLRLECLETLITNHQSFVPSLPKTVKSQEEQIPWSVVRDILTAHGDSANGLKLPDDTIDKETKSTKTEDGKDEAESKSNFTMKVNHVSFPDSPVNEYGITVRAMRCLEITESVCQVRDLMDFSMREKERHLGPIDGLRRLTAQYRERDSQLQRQVLTPSNALHFDSNVNLSNPNMEDQLTKQRKGQQQQPESNSGGLGGEGGGGGGTSGQNVHNGRSVGPHAPSPIVGGSPSKRQR